MATSESNRPTPTIVDIEGDPADPRNDRTTPVAIHLRGPGGAAGAFVAPGRSLNPTAVAVAGEARALLGSLPAPDRPAAPDPALVVVAGRARPLPVALVHTSTRTEDVLLEVASGALPVDESDPELSARSIWCILFPRMRGC